MAPLNPLDVWAPIFRAPFSGDVTQSIAPRLFSPDIKGIPEIEHKVETEVASFGKQLCKLLEAVEALGKQVELSDKEDAKKLACISKLVREIDAVKERTTAALEADAEDAMRRLKKADASAWKRIISAGERSSGSSEE